MSDYLEAIAALDRNAGTRPHTAGKWTPVQHTAHLALAYELMTNGLRGAPPPQSIGTARQRRIWRIVGLFMLRHVGRLPRARSPKEILPPSHAVDLTDTVAWFSRASSDFAATIADAHERMPHLTVRHPYLDTLTLFDLARLAAVHTRHHARQLR